MKRSLPSIVAALAAALLLCTPLAYGQTTTVQEVEDEAGITINKLVVWLVVGAVAGTIVGWMATRRKGGLGHFKNIALGMAGALVGVFLFDLLGIDLGLGSIVIMYSDVVAALAGSVLILVLVLWMSRRFSSDRESRD